MAVLDTNEIFYTTFQPKVKNQGIVYVDGVPSFMVYKMNKPAFSHPDKKIDHINSYFTYAGKRKWEKATITAYDPVTPSGAQAFMDWARLCYENVTGRMGYIDFYKKDIVYDDLGPVGDIVGEWIYKGAWISNFKSGELDWTNEGDFQELTVEITYDYAVLNF